MLTLVSQIRKAMQLELYYVALFSTLSIPDIGGALGSENGEAEGKKYRLWYEQWVRPRLAENRGRDNPLSGDDCYGFRCSMLHQGMSQRPKDRYKRIVFIEPGYPNYGMHYVRISGEVLLIQIDQFVEEVLCGCEIWLEAVKGTEPFETNYKRFARRHPEGLAPYVMGTPVVG